MDEKLLAKLRIPDGGNILILEKPDFVQAFNGVSYDVTPANLPYDFVLAFVFSVTEMAEKIKWSSGILLLKKNGRICFAYPKKGNGVYSDYIERDNIMENLSVDDDGYFENTLYKFNIMVSLDNVFTIVGLKYTDRSVTIKQRPSQRSADYAGKVPGIAEKLRGNTGVLALYENLAPGYQKDWARYIYSARTDATRKKRFAEMVDILEQGYKSIALFRQKKK
ncbi:YdeI/OmpD-associated family protein [Brucepastera parasyntrophica]|uniref:YdeI/OmpD-associated family protein n=1 Tax=Brucepastera parasyntrophica TaxID=2880008 RepID=UPI00210D20DE|nr:YdeI/OmpD-associated family protein [Brucepastera parasyntrophica]ULQ59509.1 YdeI/OmpD-associated family protein [Brucepastera parasyntrophica]